MCIALHFLKNQLRKVDQNFYDQYFLQNHANKLYVFRHGGVRYCGNIST